MQPILSDNYSLNDSFSVYLNISLQSLLLSKELYICIIYSCIISSSSIIFINELLSETTTHYRNFFQIYSHYVKIIPENSSNIIEFIFFFSIFTLSLPPETLNTVSIEKLLSNIFPLTTSTEFLSGLATIEVSVSPPTPGFPGRVQPTVSKAGISVASQWGVKFTP